MNRFNLKMLTACIALALANTACTVDDAPHQASGQIQGTNPRQGSPVAHMTGLGGADAQEQPGACLSPDGEPEIGCHTLPPNSEPIAETDDGPETCLSPDGIPEEGCHTVPSDDEPETCLSPDGIPEEGCHSIPNDDEDDCGPEGCEPEPPPLECGPEGCEPEPPPHECGPEGCEPEPPPLECGPEGCEPDHPIPDDDELLEECDGLDNDFDGVIDESPDCAEPQPFIDERDDLIRADCSDFEAQPEAGGPPPTGGNVCAMAGLKDGSESCYIWPEQPDLPEGESGALPPTIREGCIVVQYCIGRNITDAAICEPADDDEVGILVSPAE